MDRNYFEEKKQLSLDGIKHAQNTAKEVICLLSTWDYSLPNNLNPATVHDHIRDTKQQLDGVLRNFEKARWACSSTGLDFDRWLIENGHSHLIYKSM